MRVHADRRSRGCAGPLTSALGCRLARALVCCLATGLAGCSALLPKASATIEGRWTSYEAARVEIEGIRPYTTTRADLHAAGIDPFGMPGITILSYADLVQRFAAGAAVRPDELDRGVRDCLLAGKACTGYAIRQQEMKRDRVGNFFLDALSFRRLTDVRGWSFNALIVFVGDGVVYTLAGGQPVIRETETTRNPLGPFQSWGDSVGRSLFQ